MLTWLFLAYFLVSCFGGSSPERVYFSVDYPLVSQKRYDKPKYPKSVLVQHFTTVLAYDRQELVYRANPYEFKYYWYRLWASRPRKMLQEVFAKHLRYTGLFESVSLVVEDKVPDYTIEVEIIAIEELDVTETEWYSRLAMRIRLIRFADGGTIWHHEFDAKKAVAENKPVYVVKAMSEVMDNELTKAFELMDDAVGRDIAKRKRKELPMEDAEKDLASEPEQSAIEALPMLESQTPDLPTQLAPAPSETPEEPKVKPKATLRERN
ncbi:MAG: ABC-type transport auxiliary lipoprotein family protein [Bradymonadales bacterium]